MSVLVAQNKPINFKDHEPYHLAPGTVAPLGATVCNSGINFALKSGTHDALTLVLFDALESHRILQVFHLNKTSHMTDGVWHAFIHGAKAPIGYQYLADVDGHTSILLDPYAREVNDSNKWLNHMQMPTSLKLTNIVTIEGNFDWQGDKPPQHPWHDTFIYEMHVRGFTVRDVSISNRGTFSALQSKIPYLLQLGVTAIELMPIFEFDEKESYFKDSNGNPLQNYWGYQPFNFFAPMRRYSSSAKFGESRREFKEMVRAMHKNGIEVILDVVYNHTSGLCHQSPLYMERFKHYFFHPEHGYELNFSGCGNTLNPNSPQIQQLILASMRYWVQEMHVDGFRLDLATVLQRSANGELLNRSHLIETITKDPVLHSTKLIAEPWDAQGGYQIGHFGAPWSEWNDKFRDDVRRFLNGQGGSKGTFATRLCGSSDIFQGDGAGPTNSINFIACHDGFTLADLTSYSYKHNHDNGENNCDGTNENYSWNGGTEGPTDDDAILQLRQRQRKNFMLALFLSNGVPMLHMGDERCHTKFGNNNSYCQGDEINGLQWENLDADQEDMLQFVTLVSSLRRSEPAFQRSTFLTDDDVTWHGRLPNRPNWDDGDMVVALSRHSSENQCDYYIAFNASHEDVLLTLPKSKYGKFWRLFLDSAITAADSKINCDAGATYVLRDHSSLIFISQ